MSNRPTPNGANGRGPAGRFAKGWRGGPGNPNSTKVARLRQALLAAVQPADIRAAVVKLLELAKAGDLAAIRELFDRCVGKAGGEPLAVHVRSLPVDAAALAGRPPGTTRGRRTGRTPTRAGHRRGRPGPRGHVLADVVRRMALAVDNGRGRRDGTAGRDNLAEDDDDLALVAGGWLEGRGGADSRRGPPATSRKG